MTEIDVRFLFLHGQKQEAHHQGNILPCWRDKEAETNRGREIEIEVIC